MSYRPKWSSRSWVFLVSIILAGIVANVVFRTPNATGGGAAMMVVILLLAVAFKVTIEFFLTKWLKRRDEKRDDEPVV